MNYHDRSILRAASRLLFDDAAMIKDAHTLKGKGWGGELGAKAAHEKSLHLARELRRISRAVDA